MIECKNEEKGLNISFDGDIEDICTEITVLCAVFCRSTATCEAGFDGLKKAIIDNLEHITYENTTELIKTKGESNEQTTATAKG